MILRYIGYALSFCAIVMSGFEIVRYLETRETSLLTIQQAWRIYNAEALDSFNKAVSESYFPGLWDDIIATMIGLPLLAALILFSAFLLFVSRHAHLSS